MGMEVKLDLNPSILAETHAKMVRGLQAAGELILAEAVALAPTEPEPRHGVHLRETGFVRPQTDSGAHGDRVMVGFTAFWAQWQEVKEYDHPNGGQSHFLETAFLTKGEAALGVVAATVRE